MPSLFYSIIDHVSRGIYVPIKGKFQDVRKLRLYGTILLGLGVLMWRCKHDIPDQTSSRLFVPEEAPATCLANPSDVTGVVLLLI